MARLNPIERYVNKLQYDPPTVRTAAGAIVTATIAVVIGGGVLIRLIDHTEYKNVWVGMWWALQTVTTVGYGDVTPARTSGRIVGAAVMLEGIAFLAIITATITSTFVARAAAERAKAAQGQQEAERHVLEARFDELERKLDRIEASIGSLSG